MDAEDAKGKGIDDIMMKLDPGKRAIMNSIRELVKKSMPDAEETVKWGNVTYLVNGENFAWILAYNDHADLGFFRGAEVKSKLLEGTGKKLRHVKIRTEEQTKGRELADLIKEVGKLYGKQK